MHCSKPLTFQMKDSPNLPALASALSSFNVSHTYALKCLCALGWKGARAQGSTDENHNPSGLRID